MKHKYFRCVELQTSIRVKSKFTKLISDMFSQVLPLSSVFLCFTTINTDLLGTEPEVTLQIQSVSCFDGADGEVRIAIPDISQTFSTNIYKYSPKANSLEALLKNDTTIFIASGLCAGKYFIEIKSDKGFSYTESVEVPQPYKLESGKILIDKKLSALNASDAILKASPEGGVPPYTYSWNIEGEDKNSPAIKNVEQGTYSCTINDANHCGPVKTTILFNQYVIPDIVED